MSRLGYGIAWFAIYVGLMQTLTGFRWRAMLVIYAQSLIATIATIAPLLAAYRWFVAPAAMHFGQLALCALLGCAGWGVAIFAVRHPVRHEVLAVAQGVLSRLPAGRVPRRG